MRGEGRSVCSHVSFPSIPSFPVWTALLDLPIWYDISTTYYLSEYWTEAGGCNYRKIICPMQEMLRDFPHFCFIIPIWFFIPFIFHINIDIRSFHSMFVFFSRLKQTIKIPTRLLHSITTPWNTPWSLCCWLLTMQITSNRPVFLSRIERPLFNSFHIP